MAQKNKNTPQNTQETPPVAEKISPEKISMGKRLRTWMMALLAGIFAWVSLVSGILAWRLAAGPIQLDWLAPRIEMALNAQSDDYAFSIGATIFTWSGADNIIELQIKDFKVQTSTGIPVALFPTAGATFDWWALLRGEIALNGLSIKHPTFAVKRFKDGTFSISGGDEATAPTPTKNNSIQNTPTKNGQNTTPTKSNTIKDATITDGNIIDETIKKQNINAFMDTVLLRDKTSSTWAKSLQFINISNGRVIFIEDGHSLKWTMPDFNATLFRNDGGVTLNASSPLTLTENFRDKSSLKSIKQGNLAIELASPNNNDATTKNKIAMKLSDIDVRFINQFLIPNTVKLTYDEHLDGTINLDLTQNWVPEIINMDIKSDIGQAQGDIVFLGAVGELSTNIRLTDIQVAKVIPLLPPKFPVASHITQINTRLDTTINSERFSLLTGGEITLDSTLHEGKFTLPKWFDAPVSYTTIKTKTHLNFKLDASKPATNSLHVTTTPLTTRIDTHKTTVNLETQYKFADASSITDVQASLDGVTIDNLAKSWPKPLVPETRDWVINRIQNGQANATLKTRITHNKGITHIQTMTGTIGVQDATLVKYYGQLPDIKNINATIAYDKDKMNIAFAQAKTAKNALDGSKVTLSYKNNPTISVRLKTTGDVQEILTALANSTDVLEDSPINAQNIAGDIAGTADFTVSLSKKSVPLNAKINVTGENLTLNKPDWNIANMTVQKATFALEKNTITVNSQNTLNNHPINVNWQHSMAGKSMPNITDKLKISGTFAPEKQTLGDFKLADIARGTTDFTVRMNRYNRTKNWTFDASADVSKTALVIEQLAWQKTDKTRGVLSTKGIWTNTNTLIVKDLKLRVMPNRASNRAPNQTGSPKTQFISLTGAGKYDLNTGTLNQLTITNLSSDRFRLGAVYKKQNQKTYLQVKGDKADVNYITQNLVLLSSGEEKTAANVKIDLKTVTAGDRGTLDNVKIDWVKNAEYTEHFKTSFLQKTVLINAPKEPSKPILKTPKTGDKQKTINPKAPHVPKQTLSVINMVPKGRAFALNANIHDIGALIEFLDIDRGITGGQTIIKASRPDPFGTVTGTIKTADYHMSDAPNFGRLLQVISLADIFKALSNQGITFKRLESDFTWKGNVINLQNGITNSSTVGFTFKGGLNTKTKVVALQGTAIPFYGLSKIVGSIPIVGTILTAGEGIYAVNYSVEGDMKDPKITGNPLSALAPGILRKLFPSNADKSILKDKEAPKKELNIKTNVPSNPSDPKSKSPAETAITPAPTAPVKKN